MTYIIRHSERIDYADESFWKQTRRYTENSNDPTITKRGIKLASDATKKILNNMNGSLNKYSYIYSSPFARCIDTSIIIATYLNIIREKRGISPIRIRIDYGLREFNPIPLRNLMDNEMSIGSIIMRYRNHVMLFDTFYESSDSFDDMKQSSLNPMNEVYRPLDAMEKIYNNDHHSIICTHGLNIAIICLKFPSDSIRHIHGGELCRGNTLSSYCYTLMVA